MYKLILINLAVLVWSRGDAVREWLFLKRKVNKLRIEIAESRRETAAANLPRVSRATGRRGIEQATHYWTPYIPTRLPAAVDSAVVLLLLPTQTYPCTA